MFVDNLCFVEDLGPRLRVGLPCADADGTLFSERAKQGLRQNLMHHFAVNVGEPERPAVVGKGQTFMIHAQQV